MKNFNSSSNSIIYRDYEKIMKVIQNKENTFKHILAITELKRNFFKRHSNHPDGLTFKIVYESLNSEFIKLIERV